jgi:capreomycidine synthase
MQLPPAPLEDWLRDYYFSAEIDISASGVQPYSLAEVRERTGLRAEELDGLVMDDGYSLGTPAVRELLAAGWGNGDPSSVMTTSGSSEAISLVLSALLRPGDDVVVLDPGYHTLVDYARGLGCRLRSWRMRAADEFRPDPSDLAGLIRPGTRAVIANFPHNPTGATIDEATLRELVERADRVGAYVLWDAAFASLTYETAPLPDVTTLYPLGVSFGTFSKAFGLPGLRFGWTVAPPELLADCVRIRDYTTLHLSPLVELIALGVLRHADAFTVPRLEQARANRRLLLEWVGALDGRVVLDRPSGGVAAFPRIDVADSTDALCERLFHDHGVLVIPGSCFGYPQHLRIGYGGPGPVLAEGLDRLAKAL